MLVLMGKYLYISSFIILMYMHEYDSSRLSRKILWLELTSTNNDPNVVVKFFLDIVVKLEGSYRS